MFGKCSHCEMERPYKWIGGQHCTLYYGVPQPKALDWPASPMAHFPSDWPVA